MDKDRTRLVYEVAKAHREAEMREKKVQDSAKTIEGLLNNLRSRMADHALHLAGLQGADKHQHEVYRDTWTHHGQHIHKSFAGFVEFSRSKLHEQVQNCGMPEGEKDDITEQVD